MDIQKLLSGSNCSCGRHHRCDIGFIAIEKDAISHLSALTEDYRSILLVADDNTYAAAGKQTQAILGTKHTKSVIFSGSTVLIPNEAAVAAVEAELDGIELIVGIGSGVIQDICKYVAFFHSLPYCIIATAPSMDGYASNGAAMIMGGMKVTYSCKVPFAILADTQVLKEAPMDMILAGYGDIVGKYSALNDWLLSRVVNGEYFCQEIYDLTLDMVHQTLAIADGLKHRDEESIRVLMEALVVAGIAMSFAGSSRPASGSEHHLSHFFEITGILRNEPYLAHGLDVACSTVITAKLREKLLSVDWPEASGRPDSASYEADVHRIYGRIAESYMALQDKNGFYRKDMVPIYKEKERQIRDVLAQMPAAEEIESMLEAVGITMEFFFSLYGSEKIADAVLYSKELKDRYSVLWLYYDLFGTARRCPQII